MVGVRSNGTRVKARRSYLSAIRLWTNLPLSCICPKSNSQHRHKKLDVNYKPPFWGRFRLLIVELQFVVLLHLVLNFFLATQPS